MRLDTHKMSDPLSKMMTSPDAMSKMLPAVPDMDTQLALAAKMIDKKTATHKVGDKPSLLYIILNKYAAGFTQLRFLLP